MPVINYSRVVILSRPVSPDMPHWPGDPRTEFSSVTHLDRDGYFLRSVTMGEHSSTHVNAPASFYSTGPTVDAMGIDQHILPAVCLDISGKAQHDPDARLLPEDIATWESQHGRIAEKCLVLLHTGWAEKWESPDDYFGIDQDGAMHFPGFGPDAARLLVRERGVAGLGIDTHGLDPGTDTDFTANREILDAEGLALECLDNLDQLPPVGATVITAPLRLEGGSGSPATVLALVP